MDFSTPIAAVSTALVSTSTGIPAMVGQFGTVIAGLVVFAYFWKIKRKATHA